MRGGRIRLSYVAIASGYILRIWLLPSWREMRMLAEAQTGASSDVNVVQLWMLSKPTVAEKRALSDTECCDERSFHRLIG